MNPAPGRLITVRGHSFVRHEKIKGESILPEYTFILFAALIECTGLVCYNYDSKKF